MLGILCQFGGLFILVLFFRSLVERENHLNNIFWEVMHRPYSTFFIKLSLFLPCLSLSLSHTHTGKLVLGQLITLYYIMTAFDFLMIDFGAFWSFQDSFGRLGDRGKEVPKATKLLTKLFPNKVAIHMPQVCVMDYWFFSSLIWTKNHVQCIIEGC
jgi:hypothetical protein